MELFKPPDFPQNRAPRGGAENKVKLIFRNLKDKQGIDLRFLPKLPGLAHEYFYLPWGIPGCSGL